MRTGPVAAQVTEACSKHFTYQQQYQGRTAVCRSSASDMMQELGEPTFFSCAASASTCDGSEKKFLLNLSIKDLLKSEIYTVTPSTASKESSCHAVSWTTFWRAPQT